MDQERYAKQIRFRKLGNPGQVRLAQSHVLIVGVGALGSHVAETLGRAGVGRMTLVDRDFVELSNLHRQALYDEDDCRQILPKAVAAAKRLARINSNIVINPVVADVQWSNLDNLLNNVDLMIDGSDNFNLRFLLNEAAVQRAIPWVYGGCVGSTGMAMTIVPGMGPCLRCIYTQVPSPGSVPTCDAAGILAPTVQTVAAYQAAEALKVLTGNRQDITRGLFSFDLWTGDYGVAEMAEPREDCPNCRKMEFEFLSGSSEMQVQALCGSNSVQVSPPQVLAVDLEEMERRLSPIGTVKKNPFLLSLSQGTLEMILFKDGRAMIKGTTDTSVARDFYTRMVGI